MSASDDSPAEGLPSLPGVNPPDMLQGRQPCRDLLRQTLCDLAPNLGRASAGGNLPDAHAVNAARELWLIDRVFENWPLDDPAVLESLSTWLRPAGRTLHLVGADFNTMARAYPRFARWRRDWSHGMEVVSPVDGLLTGCPRGLLAGPVALMLLDAPDWRLQRVSDSSHLRAFQTQCADFLQRCEPAWAVTTLGL